MADEQRKENGAHGSNIPDALIVFHHSELSKLEREEEQAKAVVNEIKARKKKYRKTIQADGLKLGNFDFARKLLLAEEDDVKADLAETGRILLAFKAPIGHQFDMFAEPDRATLEERWKYQGFLVGSRAGDLSENPHHPGDKSHKFWLDGYKGAQAAIAAGMEQSQSSREDESEPAAPQPAGDKPKRGDASTAETHFDDAGVDIDDDGEAQTDIEGAVEASGELDADPEGEGSEELSVQ